jgi:hypothetical protein
MSFLDWFRTAEIDAFAKSISGEIIRRVPPSSVDAPTKRAAGDLKNSHHAIYAQAEQFALTHSLNVYKRARLGNSFSWALRDAGYPPDFVDAWTYELVTFVTLKAANGRKAKR